MDDRIMTPPSSPSSSGVTVHGNDDDEDDSKNSNNTKAGFKSTGSSLSPTYVTKEEDDKNIPYDKWNWLSSSHHGLPPPLPPLSSASFGEFHSSTTNSIDERKKTQSLSSPTSHDGVKRYEKSLRHLPTASRKWRLVHSSSSSSSSSSPRGRCSHSVIEINNHTLLLFGGGYSASSLQSSQSNSSSSNNKKNVEDVVDGRFIHLEDMWTLDALSAKWTKVHYNTVAVAAAAEKKEEEESYWGMKFGPPRRNHAAAYYNGYVSTDSSSSSSLDQKHYSAKKKKHGGVMIVFGGITEASSPSSTNTTTKRNTTSNPQYLGDTWIFHLSTKQWRRLPSSSPPHSSPKYNSKSSSSSNNTNRPPSPRRGAISWIDNDYFYIFGGEDARGTSAAFADAIHGVDLIFDDDDDDNDGGNHDDNVAFNQNENAFLENQTQQQQQSQPQPQHCPIIFKLGPLSNPDINTWKWTIQKSYNSSFLHKRAPNWPTVATSPKPFGSVAFAAHAVVGRRLWIFGGLEWHLGGPESQLFYRLDLDTFEWVVLHAPKNAPCPRYMHGMTSIGRYLLIGGGVGLLRHFDVVVDVADDGTTPPVVQMEDFSDNDDDDENEESEDEEDLITRVVESRSGDRILLHQQRGDSNEENGEVDGSSSGSNDDSSSSGSSSSSNNEDERTGSGEGDTTNNHNNTQENLNNPPSSQTTQSSDNNNNNTNNNPAIPINDIPSIPPAAAAAPPRQPQPTHHHHHHHNHNHHHRNWQPTFAIQERTIFDLHLFDTETMKWFTLKKGDVKGPWPSARNAFSLSRLGRDRAIVFGGGVYPSCYYDDTFVLEFDLPCKVPKPTGSMEDDICQDMSKLLSTGLMSDMTLIAGGTESSSRIKEFPVHKVILALRCNFFRIMFSGPYAESSASEIHLPDVDPDALEIVLKYIYTGLIDCQSIIGDDDGSDDNVMFFRGCAMEGDGGYTINSSLELISSVLRLCDMWELTKLFDTLEDLLALSAKRCDSSKKSSLSCYADTIGLIVFAKAHNCKRLVMQGLEFARRRWDKMSSSAVVKEADVEIVAEIEDFVKSLL